MKSIAFLIAILFVWTGLAYTVWELQLFVTLLPWIIPHPKLKKLRYQFWIWQDQGVSVLFGGHADETVSSRVGVLYLNGSKTAAGVRAVVDFIFYIALQQKNHCVESIEWDEQHQKEEIAMPAGKKKIPPKTTKKTPPKTTKKTPQKGTK